MSKGKIALVVLVVAALAVAQRSGVLAEFGNPASIKRTLIGLGLFGQFAFVLAYAVLQPFGIPGTVFILAAPLIWPWPVAFALSMIGTMAASVVGFSFARYVGRDFIQDKIPPRVRRYEEALERRSFATVFLLRFVFWMPQWLHVFLGVSKVRGATHFWASFLGYLVPIFLVSYFGEALFNVLRALPVSTWLWAAAATVALGLGGWVAQRRIRA